MVDLTPKAIITDTPPAPSLTLTGQVSPEPRSNGLVDKLKMSFPIFPMTRSDANAYGINTSATAIYGTGVGGNLSERVSVFAGGQGIYDLRNTVSEIPSGVVIDDPLMNRPLVYNSKFSSFSVKTGVNYNLINLQPSNETGNSTRASLDVSVTENMDFLFVERGKVRLNAVSFIGNKYGGLQLSAYRGRDFSPGSDLNPTRGYSINGTLQTKLSENTTLIGQAGMSKDEMTMPKSTQPGAIDYGSGVVKSNVYNGRVALAGKSGYVDASLFAMKDNQGYDITTYGLGGQIGATSIRGNVTCMGSAEQSKKCNNVGVNIGQAW